MYLPKLHVVVPNCGQYKLILLFLGSNVLKDKCSFLSYKQGSKYLFEQLNQSQTRLASTHIPTIQTLWLVQLG